MLRTTYLAAWQHWQPSVDSIVVQGGEARRGEPKGPENARSA